MSTIKWFFDLGLSVLCVCAGIWLFGYIVKNGTGAIKDLIRTIGLTVKAVCVFIQRKLFEKAKKEEPEEVHEEPKPDFTIQLTYDEFCKMMKDKEGFTL